MAMLSNQMITNVLRGIVNQLRSLKPAFPARFSTSIHDETWADAVFMVAHLQIRPTQIEHVEFTTTFSR